MHGQGEGCVMRRQEANGRLKANKIHGSAGLAHDGSALADNDSGGIIIDSPFNCS